MVYRSVWMIRVTFVWTVPLTGCGHIVVLSVQQEADGEVVVEGFLNISWGVQRPIRLKIQDDKQALSPSPVVPVDPMDPMDPVDPVDPVSPVSPLENKRFLSASLQISQLSCNSAALMFNLIWNEALQSKPRSSWYRSSWFPPPALATMIGGLLLLDLQTPPLLFLPVRALEVQNGLFFVSVVVPKWKGYNGELMVHSICLGSRDQ